MRMIKDTYDMTKIIIIILKWMRQMLKKKSRAIHSKKHIKLQSSLNLKVA